MQLITLSQPSKVENLKQNIADMEEKVQYQSEERLRDIHDLLDSCHTRVGKELKGHFLEFVFIKFFFTFRYRKWNIKLSINSTSV